MHTNTRQGSIYPGMSRTKSAPASPKALKRDQTAFLEDDIALPENRARVGHALLNRHPRVELSGRVPRLGQSELTPLRPLRHRQIEPGAERLSHTGQQRPAARREVRRRLDYEEVRCSVPIELM